MSQTQTLLAPSGALTLRQLPEYPAARAVVEAIQHRFYGAVCRGRRTRSMEGIMHPDSHNFFASPSKGTTINAGQFGSLFAPHPCQGCADRRQAYDAETPARPQQSFKQAIAALLVRKRL